MTEDFTRGCASSSRGGGSSARRTAGGSRAPRPLVRTRLRSPSARSPPRWPWPPSCSSLGLWMVASTGHGDAAPDAGPRRPPRTSRSPTVSGRSSQVAFGSVWVNATNDGQVLRVDPRTRRVTARIRVGSEVSLGAGDGAIWAMPRAAGRDDDAAACGSTRGRTAIVARIPISSPGARFPFGGASIVVGPRVWVSARMGLVAVDPTRNRPVREIVLGGDFQVDDACLRGGELWVSARRTGRSRGSTP